MSGNRLGTNFNQLGSSAMHPSTTMPMPDNPGPLPFRDPDPGELISDYFKELAARMRNELAEATKQNELAEQRHLEALAASICAVFAPNLDLYHTSLIARKALEIAREIVELNRNETP